MRVTYLDAWITGHWGEDQFRNEPPEVEDEGAMMCQSALDYLMDEYAASPSDELQDALDILETARAGCLEQYRCRFCGKPTNKKNTWCSPRCYNGDGDGL